MGGNRASRRLLFVAGLSVALACVLAILLPQATTRAAQALEPDTQFFVPNPPHAAKAQIADLISGRNKADAELVRALVETSHAVWFTEPTPKGVLQQVRNTVDRAADKGTIPVLVAYNIPYRDCAQFSAGGATSVADYEAWIDAFAAGIATRSAVVVLEPDSLGIIPWYNPFGNRDSWAANPNYEWCQPADADPATAAADRFAMLKYAVAKLKANPGTRVYLDATHSGWLGAGDAADRLSQAGIADADGFFLNVSNFEANERLEKYGTWIAKCVAFNTNPASWGRGHSEWCASQYSPANPNDFSTWTLADDWYTNNVESQTWWYSASVLKHFVIDTSRNGQGPWTPLVSYPDPQSWCNPPGRGVGVRPTANTGVGLIDAYLWVKVPGESDGECTRGLGPAGTTVDPEWAVVDPGAGQWFPQFAIDLARNASPALK